jgi:histidinol-phosphatase
VLYGAEGRMPASVSAHPPGPSSERLLEVAHQAAIAGGKRTLEGFGGRVRAETKRDGSPVTSFDRASEAAIRRVIGRAFPTHAIMGEEGGATGTRGRFRWIVDPLDGTRAFVHGVPLYTVLIAVEVDGRPTVGVVHAPVLGETVEAAVGLGCRWNGRRARVSKTGDLRRATVVATSLAAIDARGVPIRQLARATAELRGWGDGYGFSLVATGRVDGALDLGLHLWDAAPLLPILTEAGGQFTDWRGRPTIRRPDVVGSNGRIHAGLLRLLRPRARSR